MSRYQAYPEYKESGVEWLGRRPSHWISTAIKYGYEVTLGKMLQKEANLPTDEFKPYLKAINIQPSGVSISNVEEMWFSIRELRSLRLRKGDLLISEGGDVGRSAIWNDELPECYIQNAINRARPRRNQSSSFLYYWMVMIKESSYIEVLCNKATIAHYTVDKLESSPLFLPPDSEAENIAAFLDHETAKIDALIEKQQRLIELLKEKRQAVISHAVTKGLNPNARMKDSGVEWLGEVPAHWRITQIKYVAELNPRKALVELKSSLECNFVPMEKLKTESLLLDEIRTVEEVISGYTCFCDEDILMAKVTPCFENRNIAIARGLKNGVGFGSTEIYVLRTVKHVSNSFLLYRLQENEFMRMATGAMTGAGGLKRVPTDFVNSFKFAIPPIPEQLDICSFIEKQKKRYDSLESLARNQVELLQERRTALISAAVTGKIDVRDWQAAA